jgi:Tfp pilus assembly protein PilN
MTVILEGRDLWNTMPGWGIVADLLPPEVTEARRVRVLRRVVIIVLASVLVLCLIAYGIAKLGSHSAQNELNAEQAKTMQLTIDQRKYSGVTAIQGQVSQVQSQVAKLLAGDIDFPKVIADIRAQLPPGMTIDQLAVTVLTVTPGASTNGGAAAPLDASGHAHIGTITLSGTGRHLTDISAFVENLKSVKGITQPYPTSNRASDAGTEYNIQVTLTDDVLSHRFDHVTTGGK